MAQCLMRTPELLKGNNTIPGVKVPDEILKEIPGILKACRDWGLDFYPTVVEFLDYDGISEVAAYGGFPVRFPHWSWGEQYEELSRGYEWGMHRIYEMVINTNPCYIYCLDSNTWVDHVTVIAHATGHNDFFKNNIFFSQTNQNMMNELANHGTHIRKYMAEWGKEDVGRFIDKVMSIQTLLDPAKAWLRRKQKDPIPEIRRQYNHPRRLKVDKGHEHMEEWINTREYIDSEKERIREEELMKSIGLFQGADKDIFGFLKDYAPLKPWQQDVISMLYEESMYFAPQGMTKTLNEGWACLLPQTLVPTDQGFIRAGELCKNEMRVFVHDGKELRPVTNWFVFKDRKTVTLRTNRGLEISGSDNHRILVDGNWVHLDDLKVGDKVQLSPNSDVWASNYVPVMFEPESAYGWNEISQKVGCNRDTIRRFRNGEKTGFDDALAEAFKEYKGVKQVSRRNEVNIPDVVNEDFGSFLGYMTGDGHISEVKRTMGITTGDEEQADRFIALVEKLFGLECDKKWDDTKWRVKFSSIVLQDLLVDLGLPTGVSARIKKIPDAVLRSPKSVMTAFLSAYFDCDAYAGKEGVILSTSSVEMTKQVQVVLLNYGIYSRKYLKDKDNWHVYATGLSAKKFMEEINFGLSRKKAGLKQAIDDHVFFCKEVEYDEIVEKTYGQEDVVDFTVDTTHQYVAQGVINHNSKVDSEIMARYGFAKDTGIVEYAVHKAGVLGGKASMNPYKLGYLLLSDIEERWNKGRFGWEYDECEDFREKLNWDKKLGLGHDKIFEVRKHYDDVTALSEFFTQEFCDKYEFFIWRRFPDGTYKIMERDANKIKQMLLQQYVNRGLPTIKLVEPNYKNKRIFLMEHTWDGRTLHPGQTSETMKALSYIWRGPCGILTKNKDGKQIMYYCEDGHVEVGEPNV